MTQPHGMPARASVSLGDPGAARQAGREALSLMLIDARNRTLMWLQAFEDAGCVLGGDGHASVPLRWIGHAAWFQEYWTSRDVQRLRGEAAEESTPRLPSVQAQSDDWFSPACAPDWREIGRAHV